MVPPHRDVYLPDDGGLTLRREEDESLDIVNIFKAVLECPQGVRRWCFEMQTVA